MKVIKLGGSLSYSQELPACLETVAKLGPGIVVVPGGGAFADQVRMAQHNWQFDDGTAHGMALLAMQQMALLFNGLNKGFVIAGSVAAIGRQLAQGNTVIWSPDRGELDEAGIKPSWEVTSDSLAAWLADRLGAAELILVKSATIDSGLSLPQLAEHGIIDGAFCAMVAEAKFAINILNAHAFNGH